MKIIIDKSENLEKAAGIALMLKMQLFEMLAQMEKDAAQVKASGDYDGGKSAIEFLRTRANEAADISGKLQSVLTTSSKNGSGFGTIIDVDDNLEKVMNLSGLLQMCFLQLGAEFKKHDRGKLNRLEKGIVDFIQMCAVNAGRVMLNTHSVLANQISPPGVHPPGINKGLTASG